MNEPLQPGDQFAFVEKEESPASYRGRFQILTVLAVTDEIIVPEGCGFILLRKDIDIYKIPTNP